MVHRTRLHMIQALYHKECIHMCVCVFFIKFFSALRCFDTSFVLRSGVILSVKLYNYNPPKLIIEWSHMKTTDRSSAFIISISAFLQHYFIFIKAWHVTLYLHNLSLCLIILDDFSWGIGIHRKQIVDSLKVIFQ